MNKDSKTDNRAVALEAAIKQITKAFGDGSIMRFGQKTEILETVSTGSIALDIAIGGGLPYGRIIEIYGPESSGKTTIALHAIAEAQKKGGICALIDTEHAFDPIYAAKIGVKTSSDCFLMSQPDNAEQALEIMDTLVRSQAVSLVVLDSVAALVPKAELEGDMGDSHMGLQARLMSQALRKLTGVISRSGCIAIFINQIRQKIGIVFGNPETTTGGNALKFYASIRLDVRRVGTMKRGDEPYGNQVTVKVVKNKVFPPFKSASIEVIYGQGIAKIGEIISLGVKYDLIQKAGSWYSIDGQKIGQGQDSVKEYLKNNRDLANALEKKIKDKSRNDDANEIGINYTGKDDRSDSESTAFDSTTSAFDDSSDSDAE
jgi:recombination protein RecA